MRTVYLDNAATTPLCRAALDAINENAELFGNPSSLHSLGTQAEKLLEASRETVKRALNVRDRHDELIFCASGSEANNLALIGTAHAKASFSGKRIVTTATEHPSVMNCCKQLEKEGYEVIYVPCPHGCVDMQAFDAALDGDVFSVSVMSANNETGAVYDLPTLLSLTRKKCPRAYFHTDATQAFMKLKLNASDFDMLTLSGHKIEAPKGIGALYVSGRVIKEKAISPVIFGGGQEKGLRGGTENVLYASALARAVEEKRGSVAQNEEKMRLLRAYTLELLEKYVPEAVVNTPAGPYLPSLMSITVRGIKSEVMLHHLAGRGIYVSSGSACSSHHKGASYVMRDFGLTESEADNTIRVSMSEHNTEEDMRFFVTELANGAATLARTSK